MYYIFKNPLLCFEKCDKNFYLAYFFDQQYEITKENDFWKVSIIYNDTLKKWPENFKTSRAAKNAVEKLCKSKLKEYLNGLIKI